MKKHILIIGGDNRTPFIGNLLKEHGFDVSLYGMETHRSLPLNLNLTNQITPCDMLLLPIPVTIDLQNLNAPYASSQIPLEHIYRACNRSTVVFGGQIPKSMESRLKEMNVSYLDYGKLPNFADANALPTAEGAIEILMKNTPYVIENRTVCVVGYGRIGKVLSQKLKALGCIVTVTARREEQLKKIEELGYIPWHTAQLHTAPCYDIIVNTVPSLVIDRNVLKNQKPNTLIVDLASKPGGVDFNYAKNMGILALHALSLPAKHAPHTAGKIIADSIIQFLHETE